MVKDSANNPADAPDDGGTATPRDEPATGHKPGRVTFDNRGNAIWEWTVNTGKSAPITSDKALASLENPALSLADDSAPVPGLPTAKDRKRGYSPYDSVRQGKAQAEVKRTGKKDLRRLSEWLKLRDQAARNRQAKD